MKVRLSVTETRYGYLDVEVPDDSPLFDPETSVLSKRIYAHNLGRRSIASDASRIKWYDPVVDVDLGYMPVRVDE